VDVQGIRSFGLTPDLPTSPGSSTQQQQLISSLYMKLVNVSPDQCMRASLNKCTSGLHFGAIQHEIIGTMFTCALDLIPFESRMLMTS